MSTSRDLARVIVDRAREAGQREAGRQANETGTVVDDNPLTVEIDGVEFDDDELLWSIHVNRAGLDPGDTLAVMRSGDEHVVLAVLGEYESAPFTVAAPSQPLQQQIADLQARVEALEALVNPTPGAPTIQ